MPPCDIYLGSDKDEFDNVSILVLVDAALRLIRIRRMERKVLVSILVLVDAALRHRVLGNGSNRNRRFQSLF